ncbi:ABC transporter substrate-binding protein [Stackebrandtia soli]|uniref:ABC transporter substrate-binding protein n=1 Tax=Stackebrandtia soli TaxID=1892856 RepID=UPI0039ECD1D0
MTPNDFDLSRRRLFQMVGVGAVGATGLVALSACSKADPGIQDKGAFHGAYPYEQPPDGHYNCGGAPYAPVLKFIMEGPYRDLMVLPSAYYYWDKKEWEYMLAEGSALDVENETFTVNLRSGLTWSNGDPITSADYETTLWIQWLQNAPSWASIESIEAADELTFVVHLSSPSAVIERYILRGNVLPTSIYGEWADKVKALVEDGKTRADDEAQTLAEEFNAFRPEELLVSGPFNIDPDRVTDTEMTLVKNDKGFAADRVKFDKIVIYNGETPAVNPLVKDGSVDYATHAFSPNQEKAYKELGRKILRPPNYSGPGMFINFKALPELNDPVVRRAIAHAINREDTGVVALGDSGVPVQYMAGFSDIMVPDWVEAADLEKLNKYEYDVDKAASLLEQAGWKKDGDRWTTADGNPAEYELRYPGDFADWSAAGDNVAEQLTAFGIVITVNAVDFEQYVSNIAKGDFEIAIQTWGSSTHPHPHFAFVSDLFQHNTPITKSSGGDGIAFDLNVETEAFGELNLEDVVNEAGRGLDLAEQKANVTKAALAFNELLPIIPLFERYGNNPCQDGEGQRVKKFPDEDDPILRNAAYADNPIIMLMLTGDLEPNE